ncbi:cytochrome P450 [Aspergillus unguis]
MALEELSKLLFFLVAGTTFVFFRILYQTHQLRRLEALNGCKDPPNESKRFKYDLFGIRKAIEVCWHMKNRTFLAYTNSLFKKYGETYTFSMLGYRFIFTYNTANIGHTMHAGLSDFDSAPLRKHLFEPLMPHNIFTLDGTEWRKSREELRVRLARPRNIVDLDILEGLVQAASKRIPDDGMPCDIQELIFALSLDIQSSLFLGECVDSLSPSQTGEKKQFVQDLLFCKDMISIDGFRGPLRHLFFPSRLRFLMACSRIRRYIDACAARQTTNQTERRLFNEQVMVILLANDSTGTTLSGLFFELSKNERIVKKLRESILETVGDSPPTWQQLSKLHYVRWTLQEALRLYPPSAVNARLTNKNTTLPTGGGPDGTSPISVRKGDVVFFSTWALHRLGTAFGDQPEEFRPERWETLTIGMPGYIPFNKGARICPGQLHAMPILTYVVARLFQTYSKVIDYNTQPFKERINLTLENENGVHVGLC